jgi:LDH2 family malate/lactate/ureidoglycolate dehydrogenase
VARYPGQEDAARLSAAVLEGCVAEIFRACGMSAEDASVLARSLVAADRRGIHSHGVLRVPEYVEKLRTGGVDPRGRPVIVTDAGSLVVCDGGNSMGQIGAHFAMALAVERGRRHGIALVALRGSNHCGAMDQYAMMAVPRGMVGIAASNALPTMAPWGGLDKIVGMNPLAVALPAGEETPVVLDIAFGATAHGKMRVYARNNQPIPADWAFDVEGKPTTDAAAALDGLIRPAGGHKGIGLAMAWGLLATAFSGAAYGTDLGNMRDGPRAGADGQVFIAIDPAPLLDPAVFRARVDRAVREVRESRPAAAAAAIYTPGMLEAEIEREYGADGIPIAGETIAGIREAAGSLDVATEGWPEALRLG